LASLLAGDYYVVPASTVARRKKRTKEAQGTTILKMRNIMMSAGRQLAVLDVSAVS